MFNGNGDGTFQPEHLLFNGVTAVAVGDFNRDGRPDVAYASGTTAAVTLGAGNGSFGTPVTFTVAWGDAIAIGDVDGDGHLAVATRGYTILFGDGRADCGQQATGGIVLADVDGDGKLDIVNGMGSTARSLGRWRTCSSAAAGA